MEKIKEFIHVTNSNLSSEENLKIQNRSNHENIIHQAIFMSIDEFSKRVIKDINNKYSDILFESNQLNLVSDESTIEQLIISGLRKQGHSVNSLNNPEMIYRAFNFVKPDNLLPLFKTKLYLIKQLGITEFNKEKTYVINPYFFAFKISFDIFLNSLFCSQYDKELEAGLVQILTDKYGVEFGEIYRYVSFISNKSMQEGRINGDKEDETFIKGVRSISGTNNEKIFNNFIYESGMMLAQNHAKALKS